MTSRWIRCALVFLLALTVVNVTPLLLESSPPGSPAQSGVAPANVVAVPVAGAAGIPYPLGMAASIVLGQPNFVTGTGTAHPNASGFYHGGFYPTLDAAGNLWAPDFSGNRVLEFPAPLHTGEAAALVLGQQNFSGNAAGLGAANLTDPVSVAFDAHGDLWVSEPGADRIVEFQPPFSTGMAASLILGASSFNSTLPTAQNAQVDLGPGDVAFDPSGDLWVTNIAGNRVVEYRPPFSDGMGASLVLGQTTFTGRAGGLAAANLSSPISVAPTPTMVWIADDSNNRVLGFPAPFHDGEAATVVLGQTIFTSSNATGAASLVGPTGVTVDSAGHLWVTSGGQSRVVEFPSDPSTFAFPLTVLGQDTFTGNSPGVSATNLSSPYGVFVGSDSIWVGDPNSDRVLGYIPTTYAVSVDESGLPAGTSWSFSFQNVTYSTTGNTPVQFSRENGTYLLAVTPVAGYVADPAYLPVAVNGTTPVVAIQFRPTGVNPFSNGMPATVVLGQENLWNSSTQASGPVNGSNLGGSSYAAAFDAHGDLWVADWNANRVVEYVPPFHDGMAATRVLGQSNLSGTLAGNGPANLSAPDGVAFDSQGNLWVASYRNNRVVEFLAPLSDGEAASVILGQSGFNGTAGTSSATGLNGPSGIAFDGSTLFVTDYSDARVVGYPAPQITGEAASIVLGQDTLTGHYSGTTAVNLSEPGYVVFDARGDMWVADYGNNRAVMFPAPLTTGEAATVVIGQGNFTTRTTSASYNLDGPNGLGLDAAGNLWIASSQQDRVLEYAGPTMVTNESPERVIGQGNFTLEAAGTGPRGLSYPVLPIFDARGNLWIDDQSNNRLLGYLPTEYSLTFSAQGSSAPATWNLSVDGAVTAVRGSIWTIETTNATLAWTVSAPGWSLPAYRGNVVVNGANGQVNLSFSRVEYAVTFTEHGLPTGTNWSVTFNGTLRFGSIANLSFFAPNGTYAYTIGNVSGYAPARVNGSVSLNGASGAVAVTFASVPTSPSGSSSTILWVGIGVVLLIVGIATALLLRRRGRGPSSSTASTPPSPATEDVSAPEAPVDGMPPSGAV